MKWLKKIKSLFWNFEVDQWMNTREIPVLYGEKAELRVVMPGVTLVFAAPIEDGKTAAEMWGPFVDWFHDETTPTPTFQIVHEDGATGLKREHIRHYVIKEVSCKLN